MMRRISVGLVDSGVCSSTSAVQRLVKNGWKGRFRDYTDRCNHGTQCAVILARARCELVVYSVKVFGDRLVTDVGTVLQGIRWCIAAGVKIINVSISVTEPGCRTEFSDLCAEAATAGVIVVAAADNLGEPTLPAYLESVIGVGVASIDDDGSFLFRDHHSVECYTNGSTISIAPSNPSTATHAAASFATARMATIIAAIVARDPAVDVTAVRRVLRATGGVYSAETCGEYSNRSPQFSSAPRSFRDYGTPVHIFSPLRSALRSIRKAVVGPKSYETVLFESFRHMLPFELVDSAPTFALCDGLGVGSLRPSQIARSANAVGGESHTNHTRRDNDGMTGRRSTLDDMETFFLTELRRYLSQDFVDLDTVILLASAWPQEILTEAAAVCNALGKNLLVPGRSTWQECATRIEPSTGQRSAQSRPPAFLDKDVHEVIDRIPLDHTFSPRTPVLAVVHLSNVALGKWHSELALRNALLQGGIRIAQAGSAPYSELFGMEHALSWNHFSSAFPIQLLQTYASALLESVEAEHSGSPRQLFVVSVDYRPSGVEQGKSHTWASLAALAFLTGVQPDALLVVLNECDDLGRIMGPLRAIQSLSQAPLLGAIQNQFYNPVSGDLLPKQVKHFLDQSRSSLDSQWGTRRNESRMKQLGVRSYDLLNNHDAADLTEVIGTHFALAVKGNGDHGYLDS